MCFSAFSRIKNFDAEVEILINLESTLTFYPVKRRQEKFAELEPFKYIFKKSPEAAYKSDIMVD